MCYITLLLIIVTSIISFRGLKNETFFDGYKFEVGRVLENKDYIRMVSSGFLHVSYPHLILNMMTLYFFGSYIEIQQGIPEFVLYYFSALIGGNLLALIIHKNHHDYSAVGASGAVCGIIFAYIALTPGGAIGIPFIPGIRMPAWLYGLLYVLYTIYGVRSKTDNIGHEAHLGGALVGMMIALLIHPEVIAVNWFAILIILAPTLAFIYVIIKKPQLLVIQNRFFMNEALTMDDRYNISKNKEKNDIDAILEKIHKRGMGSLTKKERQMLEEYSSK